MDTERILATIAFVVAVLVALVLCGFAVYKIYAPTLAGYGRLTDSELAKASEDAAEQKRMAQDKARSAQEALAAARARGESTEELEALVAAALAEEMAAEARRLELVNKALALQQQMYAEQRQQAVKRIKVYRAEMKERLALPTLEEIENGNGGATRHAPVKEPIPYFRPLGSPGRNGERRVAAPMSPEASQRASQQPVAADAVAQATKFGYAGKLGSASPDLYGLGYASRIKSRAFAWLTPRLSPKRSSPKKSPASDREAPSPSSGTRSPIKPPREFKPLKERNPPPPSGIAAIRRSHANIFGGLVLNGAESVPDQVRHGGSGQAQSTRPWRRMRPIRLCARSGPEQRPLLVGHVCRFVAPSSSGTCASSTCSNKWTTTTRGTSRRTSSSRRCPSSASMPRRRSAPSSDRSTSTALVRSSTPSSIGCSHARSQRRRASARSQQKQSARRRAGRPPPRQSSPSRRTLRRCGR